MTSPRIVLDPSLARYFEPGLHEPMAPEKPAPVPSRFAPAQSVTEAEHRVCVCLKALRKAAAELVARAVPDPYRDGWSKDLVKRVEACTDLLDRAVADLERLEAQERGQG